MFLLRLMLCCDMREYILEDELYLEASIAHTSPRSMFMLGDTYSRLPWRGTKHPLHSAAGVSHIDERIAVLGQAEESLRRSDCPLILGK